MDDMLRIPNAPCKCKHTDVREQMRDIFKLRSEVEEETISAVIGLSHMQRAHIHNVQLLERFLYDVVQTSGNYEWAGKAVTTFVKDKFQAKSIGALATLSRDPKEGLVGDAFCIETARKNEEMKQAIALMREGLGRNNMSTYAFYMSHNDTFFSAA